MAFSLKKNAKAIGKDNFTESVPDVCSHDGLLGELADSSPKLSSAKEGKSLDCDPHLSAIANSTQEIFHTRTQFRIRKDLQGLLQTKKVKAQIHKHSKEPNMGISSKKDAIVTGNAKNTFTASVPDKSSCDGLLHHSSTGQMGDFAHTQLSLAKEEKELNCDPQVSAEANEIDKQFDAMILTQWSEPFGGFGKGDDLFDFDSYFGLSDADLKNADANFDKLLQALEDDARAQKETSVEAPVPAAAPIAAVELAPPSHKDAARSQIAPVLKHSTPLLSTTCSKTEQQEAFYEDGPNACLHARVEDLIYWRDVKQSAIAFLTGIITLSAVALFPVVSVFAYLSLLLLSGRIAFKVCISLMSVIQPASAGQTLKSTSEGYLDLMKLSDEKVQHIAGIAVIHLNVFTAELQRLLLAKDLWRSISFGIILWVLTYIGAWINGTTLLILCFVLLFTLPKVLEMKKEFIGSGPRKIHRN